MEIARTWAEKRTMLKNISKVGIFVRKSMQELCHDEVLLALEARVQNCRGLAQRGSSVSQCRTRSSSNMNLWVPNFKLSITRNGLQYNGVVTYNMLPRDIKSSGLLSIFKRKVYNFFLYSYVLHNCKSMHELFLVILFIQKAQWKISIIS